MMSSKIEGRLPPQAIESEENVLAGMLLQNETLINIVDILTVQSFYKDSHARIYRGIVNIYKRNEPVDILTVAQELKKTKELDICGGAYYISQLTNKYMGNTEFHARIILQQFLKRELIRIASESLTTAYNEGTDVFELIEYADKNLTSLTIGLTQQKAYKLNTMWQNISERNIKLLEQKGLTGVPSGYPELDKITGGWQQPDLIIIAGRSSMGKTSLALNIARNAAINNNKPIAIFSLEMAAIQLASRIFSLESNIALNKFQRDGISGEKMLELEKQMKHLIESNLFIDDTAGISISELTTKARKLKKEHHIELLIVDYLQLMKGTKETKGNREQEVASISGGLKKLAKELQIPVIALSQLNKDNEKRADKRPMLSDLRESEAIGNDADIVLLIHRPEYYKVESFSDGSSTKGIAEIIFAKHRNGKQGTILLKFIGYLTKFESLIPKEEEIVFNQSPTEEDPF